MEIGLVPSDNGITVIDLIQLGSAAGDEPVEFLLSTVMEIESSNPPVERVPLGEFDGFFGINGASIELSTDLELARYRLGSFPEDGELTISYRGKVTSACLPKRRSTPAAFERLPELSVTKASIWRRVDSGTRISARSWLISSSASSNLRTGT